MKTKYKTLLTLSLSSLVFLLGFSNYSLAGAGIELEGIVKTAECGETFEMVPCIESAPYKVQDCTGSLEVTSVITGDHQQGDLVDFQYRKLVEEPSSPCETDFQTFNFKAGDEIRIYDTEILSDVDVDICQDQDAAICGDTTVSCGTVGKNSCTCPKACGKGHASNDQCLEYRYSNCPSDCKKVCVPSKCKHNICTADCDGEGSCVSISEAAIDQSADPGQFLLDIRQSNPEIAKDEILTYTLKISNNSSKEVQKVMVKLEIPEGLDYVADSIVIDGKQYNDAEVLSYRSSTRKEKSFSIFKKASAQESEIKQLELDKIPASDTIDVEYQAKLVDDQVAASLETFVTIEAEGFNTEQGQVTTLVNTEREAPVAGAGLLLVVFSLIIGAIAGILYYGYRQGYIKFFDKKLGV